MNSSFSRNASAAMSFRKPGTPISQGGLDPLGKTDPRLLQLAIRNVFYPTLLAAVLSALVLSSSGCGSRPVNRQGKRSLATKRKDSQARGSSNDGMEREPGLEFANHSPTSRFVGSSACRECHAEIADAYAQHPMGRSLAELTEAHPPSPTGEGPATFQVGMLQYEAMWDGKQMVHTERKVNEAGDVLFEQSLPVRYEVGAGDHGRSYFVHKDGALWMSPMTWYPQRQKWALSPNYEVENQHFSRPVTDDCLFCHANKSLPTEHTINGYQDPPFAEHAIGCERCHGPGDKHVAFYSGGRQSGDAQADGDAPGIDLTIVNPRHLESELASDVCYQCHLSGEVRVARPGKAATDYRPGMRLADFIATFVAMELPNSTQGASGEKNDAQKITGHVEQMHRSVCFQRSHVESYEDERMTCVSCHDPHRKPAAAERHKYFRDQCMNCHAEEACTEELPRRQATKGVIDNCAECHMPQVPSNVQHAAVTDHAIPRIAGKEVFSLRGPLPLAEFSSAGLAETQSPRELAIALMQQAAQKPERAGPEAVGYALPQLQSIVQTRPADAAAADALAQALFGTGQADKAIGVMLASLDVLPQHESLLGNAAFVTMQEGALELARDFGERAMKISPSQVRYPMLLGEIAIRQQRWDDLASIVERLKSLSPAAVTPYQWDVVRLVALGRTDEAKQAFGKMLELFPEESTQLRNWYESLQ